MRRLLYLLPVPLLLTAAMIAPRAHHEAAASADGAEDVVAAAARDPGVAILAPDTEARWIPFQLTPGNQIRFAMTIDGQSASAILDTGVSFTLLSRDSPIAAARASAPVARPARSVERSRSAGCRRAPCRWAA